MKKLANRITGHFSACRYKNSRKKKGPACRPLFCSGEFLDCGYMQDIEPDARSFDPYPFADEGFRLPVGVDPPAATLVASQDEHPAVTHKASGFDMMGSDRHEVRHREASTNAPYHMAETEG